MSGKCQRKCPARQKTKAKSQNKKQAGPAGREILFPPPASALLFCNFPRKFLIFPGPVVPAGRSMLGMKQHVGTVGHGRSKILSIQLLNIGIIMGTANLRMLIQIIKPLATLKDPLLPIMDGLATSAYAASGTGHDLHKIIMCLSPFNLLQQPSSISKSADHSRPDRDVIDRKLRFLNAVVGIETAASHRLKRVRRRVLLLY